jgi:hypothetical protein
MAGFSKNTLEYRPDDCSVQSSVVDIRPEDRHLRQLAMEWAIRDSQGQLDTADVVDKANEFFKFLKGPVV